MTLLNYIANATSKENLSYEELKEAVEKALPEQGGEIMPTIADELREQGLQEGLERGLEQGLERGLEQGILQNAREDVIDILEMRFEVAPQSMVKTINAIDDASILKSLHKKAVTAKSLEQFKRYLDMILK